MHPLQSGSQRFSLLPTVSKKKKHSRRLSRPGALRGATWNRATFISSLEIGLFMSLKSAWFKVGKRIFGMSLAKLFSWSISWIHSPLSFLIAVTLLYHFLIIVEAWKNVILLYPALSQVILDFWSQRCTSCFKIVLYSYIISSSR